MRLTLSLRTSQIHEVELTSLDPLLTSFIPLSSFNIDCEYRMTTRRIFVHCRLSGLPVGITLLHIVLDLRNSLNNTRREILDIDALVLVLLQIELVVNIFGEQVPDLLVINFQIRTTDQKLFCYVVRVVKVPEDVIE